MSTGAEAEDSSNILFRVVETAKQVRADPLASYRAPIDTLHVASQMMGGDANNNNQWEEFMQMCQPPTELDQETNNE